MFVYHKCGIGYHICSILYNKCSIVYYICGRQFYDISTSNLEKNLKDFENLNNSWMFSMVFQIKIQKNNEIVYNKCGILYYICCIVCYICGILYHICSI